MGEEDNLEGSSTDDYRKHIQIMLSSQFQVVFLSFLAAPATQVVYVS